MARTIRTKVYKFDELNEDAKQTVIENNYDINVSYDWWESTYEDAKNVGIEITAFDIDRSSYCKGEASSSWKDVAEQIVKEHGEMCETYKTAKDFLNEYDELVKKYSDGININQVHEDNVYEFDQYADELENDFRKSILEDYRIILEKEYEYLTSKEAIIETITCNEYEFTKDGKQF